MDRLKFVICDGDEMFSSLVDVMITKHGHEVLGMADSTGPAIGLVQHGHPDVVIVDPTFGSNSDLDVIDLAIEVGAKVITFGRSRSLIVAGRYTPEPTFVQKPNLSALERTIERLQLDHDEVSEADRRQRPPRESVGPLPTGPSDAAAFYTALNEAVEGDAIVSIVPRPADAYISPPALSNLLPIDVRTTDRLLLGATTLHVLLSGGGTAAIESFATRLYDDSALSANIEFRSVVLGAGESPTDAFDRLKRAEASVREN